MSEKNDPAPSLVKLQRFLQLRMAELGSEMGETTGDVNKKLLNNAHFIYYNYDTLSFETSLKMVAQNVGTADAITFTKEINELVFII